MHPVWLRCGSVILLCLSRYSWCGFGSLWSVDSYLRLVLRVPCPVLYFWKVTCTPWIENGFCIICRCFNVYVQCTMSCRVHCIQVIPKVKKSGFRVWSLVFNVLDGILEYDESRGYRFDTKIFLKNNLPSQIKIQGFHFWNYVDAMRPWPTVRSILPKIFTMAFIWRNDAHS